MSSNISPTGIGRRTFFKGAAFGLGAAAFGAPLLTACGGGAPASVSGTGSGVALPTYVPANIVKPDLPGNAKGVQDTYFRYPSGKIQSVKGTVGSGNAVTAFAITYGQPPPAVGQNDYWQFMNKSLNIDFQPTLVAANDLPAKFAATMAGGNVPDLSSIPVFMGLSRIPEMFSSVFADLSEFLSGDAVKAYPNLANIPTEAWSYCRIGGKIVGVPGVRTPMGHAMYTRQDIFDSLGVSTKVKNAAEFEDMCKAVTDPKANRYALSAIISDFGTTWDQKIFSAMFGAPNNWRLESDGKMTRDIETSEFKDSINFIKKLWDKGYWHPDSPGLQAAQVGTLFNSGNVLTQQNGLGDWVGRQNANPKMVIDSIHPFGAEGGPGASFYNRPLFSLTALKKTEDKERIKELLRVLDYMCAPFGTQEYFNFTYGVEGKTFAYKNGIPSVSKDGAAQMGVSMTRLANGPQALFSATPIDDALKKQYSYQTAEAAVGVKDPAAPYWAITVNQMTSLEKSICDGISQIVTGRQPISFLDDIAKTWRSGGGDELRKLYQDAIAADAKK